MAKETQKSKIERLEKSLGEYLKLIEKLQNEIYKMQDVAEGSFLNSPTYIQLSRICKRQEIEIKVLKGQVDHEKKKNEIKEEYVQKLNHEKRYNSRGAGRKEKFTEKDKELIREYKSKGDSIRAIAKKCNCSTGLVHKIINEQ